MFIVDRCSEDTPYREFAQVALRAGIRHTVSVGMPVAQNSIGALTIYRSVDTPVSQAFLEHAEVFAGYAAVVVNNVTRYANALHEVTHLRIAMESRAVIEQAKGIVMARDRCTAEELSTC